MAGYFNRLKNSPPLDFIPKTYKGLFGLGFLNSGIETTHSYCVWQLKFSGYFFLSPLSLFLSTPPSLSQATSLLAPFGLPEGRPTSTKADPSLVDPPRGSRRQIDTLDGPIWRKEQLSSSRQIGSRGPTFSDIGRPSGWPSEGVGRWEGGRREKKKKKKII